MRELPHDIISLVHFTELTESGWWDEALERYVIATLWELEKPAQLQEIKKGISKMFPVDFKAHELRLILERLEKQGDVISPSYGKFNLSLSKAKEVRESREKACNLEAKVKFDFCQRVNAFCPEVVAENVWSSFIDRFLRPLVTNEGARAYDLLTGGNKNIPSLSYVDNFLDAFPKQRDMIKQILFDFLTQDDPDVKYYLLTYLDSYFLMSASGLPAKVLTEIASISKDCLEFIIFVDTNFIYSILNLHDNPSNQAANDLQELVNSLSQNVQIHLVVRQDTLEETLGSLRYHKSRLASISYPANLAEAATRIDISGVYRTFFQRVQASGMNISAQDYFLPYENNLVQILANKGITIFEGSKSTTEYEQLYEVADDIELQLQHERDKHGDSAKSEQKISHDVVFWHFLQEQRGRKLVSPLEAKFWIVTLDYRFLAFDKFKSTKRGWLTACMHPTQLIQLLRFFVPRSPQLENTLLGVVRFPTLSRNFDPKMEQMCIRIINHLNRHKGIEDISVPTLTNILADEALRTRLYSNNLTEQDEVKAIESTLARVLAEKESMLSEKSAKVIYLEQEVEELNIQKNQMKQEEAEEEQRRKRIEKKNIQTEQELLQIEQELLKTKSQLGQTQRETRIYKSIFRWFIAANVFVGGLGAAFYLPTSVNWSWLLNHNHKLGIQLCSAICVIGLSWIIVDSDKTRRNWALGSVILGAVLALTQII
jgi:hypothetical protein